MTGAELQELVGQVQKRGAETRGVEVKSAHAGCPKRLYDTLSAFSNQDGGGVILFGIDEQSGYRVVGVYDPQDLQKRINEQCKQMIPVVRPLFTVEVIGEQAVVSAEIPGIDISDRPCYYGGVGRVRGSYIRIGDSDEPMSEYEIYSFEAFRKKYEDDIRIVEQADMSAVDTEKLTQYVESITARNQKMSALPDFKILRFLNLAADGKPTLACILLFSLYPQMFYPQYTVNAAVVFGYEKGSVNDEGVRFLDNRRIEGTIEEMLNETLMFLRKNMKMRTIIDQDTGRRVDKSEYPVIALREAVLNALVHRDYSIHTQGMPIEVIMYQNRVEIRNPGGLYGRLTIDNLGKVQPDTRNPVLARALEFLGIVENRYSGIPTMRRVFQLAGLPEPRFEDSRGEFAVTFFNSSDQQISDSRRSDSRTARAFYDNSSVSDLGFGYVGERQANKFDALLDFCRLPRSRNEIADFLGVATVHWVMVHYINPLLQDGSLIMTRPEVPKSKLQRYIRT